MRASHAEREEVVGRLKTAYAEGRLDNSEFDLRIHAALTARTRGDLAEVMSDLPDPRVKAVLAPRPSPPIPAPRPTVAERCWAALSHALGLVSSFVGPLAVMLVWGRRSRYVRENARVAVTFQLTFLAVQVGMIFLVVATLGLAALLYVPLVLGWFALSCLGAVKSLLGETYRYPITRHSFRGRP